MSSKSLIVCGAIVFYAGEFSLILVALFTWELGLLVQCIISAVVAWGWLILARATDSLLNTVEEQQQTIDRLLSTR